MIIYNPNIICAEDRARMWLFNQCRKGETCRQLKEIYVKSYACRSTSVCNKVTFFAEEGGHVFRQAHVECGLIPKGVRDDASRFFLGRI